MPYIKTLTITAFTSLLMLLFSINLSAQIQPDNLTVGKAPAFLSVKSTWADSVFNSLTPRERIAQLFMVAAYSNKEVAHEKSIATLLEKEKIGGLIFFKGTPTAQANLTNRYQSISKTPLMIAIDGEWGLAMRLDSTVSYPRQMTLGAIQDESLLYKMGTDIAAQCKTMGIHVNFAPVIDVNNNPANPVINNRAFGEEKLNVTKLGMAYMNGMQDAGIIACGKHFPGHGDTDTDSHKALPTIMHSYERLNDIELYPFRQLIKGGLASMMVAHLSIPSLDDTPDQASTLSNKIVNGLLKDSLGFEGLIFTDALNMNGVSAHYNSDEINVKAILAGDDILLFPANVSAGIDKIEAAILSGELSQAVIDERCLKVLKAKEWVGLNQYQPIDTKNLIPRLNLDSYNGLNKNLNKSALTLIKNERDILPFKDLSDKKTVYLNIGGTEKNAFIDGIHQFSAIEQIQIPRSLSAKDELALLAECGKFERIIIAFHRTNNNPARNFGITRQAIAIHQKLSHEKEVITILFGNPYVIDKFGPLKDTKAFLVAYQDNDETNNAAAQALFGAIQPKGKLPVTASEEFKAGFGLSYPEKIRLSYASPGEVGADSEKLKGIDELVKTGIRTKAFPGCQVLAIKDGQIFYNKSFGNFTYDKKSPVQNNTIYDLASITKIASTTISLIKLVESGQIDLDKRLTDYLPEIVDSTPYQNMVLREMLAHQAGLFPWIPFYAKTMSKGQLNDTIYSTDSSAVFGNKVAENLFIRSDYNDMMFDTLIAQKLIKKKYKYSDLGYYFFKEIIERQTGQKLEDFVDSTFYKLMHLATMGYHPTYSFDLDQIAPTELDSIYRKQLVWGNVHDPGAAMQGGVGGHAGLFSNAEDLGALMYMLINDGRYMGEQILSPSIISDFTRCQFCPKNRRGAGFDKPVQSLNGGPTCDKVSLTSFGHSGFTGTLTWADPENGIVYVFLSNRVYPNAENWQIVKEGYRTKIQDIIYQSFMNDLPIN
ncbi:glycoside hydrolase family 3 N-terminal domain-containing protein [Crocinitomix catalasitica]|uniref:glycoside hydrolase family 3 N-terminal domain-containing protein n=1 Tax=Crocinitomix catalasitica TaxID=184607 RepID=UPI00068815C7|nr:glycoside hydrolase family 3 N-terminal domain-containing protein [Crocinitomix catalasitica]